jgi:hypothetical protein
MPRSLLRQRHVKNQIEALRIEKAEALALRQGRVGRVPQAQSGAEVAAMTLLAEAQCSFEVWTAA